MALAYVQHVIGQTGCLCRPRVQPRPRASTAAGAQARARPGPASSSSEAPAPAFGVTGPLRARLPVPAAVAVATAVAVAGLYLLPGSADASTANDVAGLSGLFEAGSSLFPGVDASGSAEVRALRPGGPAASLRQSCAGGSSSQRKCELRAVR